MTYYVVGSRFDSGYDEIYNFIGGDVIEESAEQTWYHPDSSVWGEKTAKKLHKLFIDDSKFKKIEGKAKLDLLKAIDKYYSDNVDGANTHYFDKEKDFVIYRILGV
jgi:hypothetical protein